VRCVLIFAMLGVSGALILAPDHADVIFQLNLCHMLCYFQGDQGDFWSKSEDNRAFLTK